MNICIKDIYLIILSLIVLYLLYCNIFNLNKELFQSSSTGNQSSSTGNQSSTTGNQSSTTGYQADIEAIRNLSSIATQLTTSNKLTMPGALTVTNDLTVGGHTYIGKDKNFILDGDNKWIFHTPDDGRKILYLAPWNGKDDWDWSKQFTIDNNGNVSSAGNISSAQGHKIGNSWDGVSSSITDSKYDTNSLCIVGQGTYPNRKVTMWDKVQIYGKLATNNLDPNNMPDGWGGGIRTYDLYSSATIACGPDGKQVKSYLNSSGNGYFAGNLNVGSLTIGDWTITNDGDQGGSLRFTKNGVRYYQMFGGSARYYMS